MIRKLLTVTSIVFAFSFTSNNMAFAQSYYPMLQTYNEWDEYVNIIPVENKMVNMPYMSGSITTSDTLIGSVAYKKVYSMSDPFYSWIDHPRFMREDTLAKKVYILSADSITERLLYDFSMAIGDSTFLQWQYPSPNSFNNGYYKLDSTGVIATLAGIRTINYLSSVANPTGTFPPLVLEWIEGIGSTISPVYLDEDFGNGFPLYQITGCNKFYLSLSCAFADSVATYHDSCIAVLYNSFWPFFGDSCIFNLAGGIHENNPYELSIDAAPNPFTDLTLIRIGGDNVQRYSSLTLKIMDALGREKKSVNIRNAEFNTGITLNRQNLSNGVYFLQLYDNNKLKSVKKIIIQ